MKITPLLLPALALGLAAGNAALAQDGCGKMCGQGGLVDTFTRSCDGVTTCWVSQCTGHNYGCGYVEDDTFNDFCQDNVIYTCC
jgi:hypothetical protein